MNEKLIASLGILSLVGLQVGPEHLLNIISGLSFLQLAVLMLRGSVLLDKVRLEGWREKIPIYLVKCKKHGYQLSYPQGYTMDLRCPKCIKEGI